MHREEDRYSAILQSTLTYGRQLMNRDQEDIVIPEPQTKTRTLIPEEEKSDMIRKNVTMDMNDLNYPVSFVDNRGLDDYIQAKVHSHSQRLRQQPQESGDRDQEEKLSFGAEDPDAGWKGIQVNKMDRHAYIDDLKRTFVTDEREQPVVRRGDSVFKASDDSIMNQYHQLKQADMSFDKALLKFASSRLNPPRCLLDALDALFSLVYGVFERTESHYFTIVEKKYFLFKSYLQYADELFDVLSHLKIYMETQGLPHRNVAKADEALVRYFQTSKRPEARQLKDQVDQIAEFVKQHIEYYHVLRVSPCEPETRPRTHQPRPAAPGRPEQADDSPQPHQDGLDRPAAQGPGEQLTLRRAGAGGPDGPLHRQEAHRGHFRYARLSRPDFGPRLDPPGRPQPQDALRQPDRPSLDPPQVLRVEVPAGPAQDPPHDRSFF